MNLGSGEILSLPEFGPASRFSVGLDASGSVAVIGAWDGSSILRVASPLGGEPHILFGSEGLVWSVDISSDGRWTATGDDSGHVRLWPMPDLSKPPLHTLPRGELIAKLKTLTNLRAVRDEDSATGWTIEVGPFPGWAEVPAW